MTFLSHDFTAAQALAWLCFRDIAQADLTAREGDTVPAALERAQGIPEPSEAECRLDFFAARDLRLARYSCATTFVTDPATGSPLIERRLRRRWSALLALHVAYAVANEARRYVAPRDAAIALADACAGGRVRVTGLRSGAGDRQEIPADWWNEGRLYDGETPYSVVARGKAGSTEWTDLLFDQGAIVALWPRSAPAAPIGKVAARKRGGGRKRTYMSFLEGRLRVLKRARPDVFYGGSAYELESSVRKNLPPNIRLPRSRSALETAINLARGTILAADDSAAAGNSPAFPSTTSATARR